MMKINIISLLVILGISISLVLQFLYFSNNPEKSEVYTLLFFVFIIPVIALIVNMIIIGFLTNDKNKLFMYVVLVSTLYSLTMNILPAFFLKPSILEKIVENTPIHDGIDISLNSGFNFGQAVSTLLFNVFIALISSFAGYYCNVLRKRVIK